MAARGALARLPRLAAASRSVHSSAAASSSSVLLPKAASPRSIAQEAARISASASGASGSASPSSSSGQVRYASSKQGTEMTVRDALNSAMEEEMLRDDKVFILGEEVARCAY